MRRIRLPLRRTALFVGALLFALLALLPMRLALGWLNLDDHGFSARDAQGSIWGGVLSDVQLGRVSIGTMRAGMGALPLLLGRARLDLDGEGFDGAVTVTTDSFGVDDVTARLEVGAQLAPLPVTALHLSGVTARFTDGACNEARGAVRADIAGTTGLALPDGLSGAIECAGDTLLLPLASRSGMETLRLRFSQDGRYQGVLTLRINDPAIAPRMAALGFSPVPGGYAAELRGTVAASEPQAQ